MAESLRLIAVSRIVNGRPEPGPVWMMDPVEWLTLPGLHDGEKRRGSRDLGYRDFLLALTAPELRDWHAADRHRAFEGLYATAPWQAVLEPKVAELEEVLAAADCPRFFVAHWYEWESGY